LALSVLRHTFAAWGVMPLDVVAGVADAHHLINASATAGDGQHVHFCASSKQVLLYW
jgi:hypothetical protein